MKQQEMKTLYSLMYVSYRPRAHARAHTQLACEYPRDSKPCLSGTGETIWARLWIIAAGQAVSDTDIAASMKKLM